jgi:2-keto-4-pentenoate hydratase/2-oxohepta-3-ene-1,7-dioic acid hydratase in catechol pathway
MLFIKPSTSVIGPNAAIKLPKASERVDFEGELAIVIGQPVRNVPASRAASAILGYTIGNDVSARDLQKSDGQWGRAKGFDTFCPLGPWIETSIDASDLSLRTEVDGELRQDGRTSDLIHTVPDLVEFISGVMTLLPGDVILTGTPEGVGQKPGAERLKYRQMSTSGGTCACNDRQRSASATPIRAGAARIPARAPAGTPPRSGKRAGRWLSALVAAA